VILLSTPRTNEFQLKNGCTTFEFQQACLFAAELESMLIEKTKDLETLKAKHAPPKQVTSKHPLFNKYSESSRLKFLIDRDGFEAAIATARTLKKVYLASSLAHRTKFKSKNHSYRFKQVEAAYSLRTLIKGYLKLQNALAVTEPEDCFV
jgi:hypothetical protein